MIFQFKLISYSFLSLFLFSSLGSTYAHELDEDEVYDRELELGLRLWTGYHSKDRFESELGSYRSTSGSGIYSSGNLSPFRQNNGMEVFGKYRLYKNWKAGLIIGSGKFRTFEWKEYDTTNTYTNLNFSLSSDYLFITGHYEWFFSKFSLELGGGLGVNTTGLTPSGYSISSRRELYETKGSLLANGLSYRLETNLNYKFKDNISFQIGIGGTWHTAPYFGGSFNDKSSTLFIRDDGTIGNLVLSENTTNLVSSESAVRRLDLFYGYVQLHVGTVLHINF